MYRLNIAVLAFFSSNKQNAPWKKKNFCVRYDFTSHTHTHTHTHRFQGETSTQTTIPGKHEQSLSRFQKRVTLISCDPKF